MQLLTLMLLGTGAYALLSSSKAPPTLQRVKASSGRAWLVRIARVTTSPEDGSKKVITEVYAPAGAFGANAQTLVATYEQTGSDKDSRVVVSYGPEATKAMLDAVGKDFRIKKRPS